MDVVTRFFTSSERNQDTTARAAARTRGVIESDKDAPGIHFQHREYVSANFLEDHSPPLDDEHDGHPAFGASFTVDSLLKASYQSLPKDPDVASDVPPGPSASVLDSSKSAEGINSVLFPISGPDSEQDMLSTKDSLTNEDEDPGRQPGFFGFFTRKRCLSCDKNVWKNQCTTIRFTALSLVSIPLSQLFTGSILEVLSSDFSSEDVLSIERCCHLASQLDAKSASVHFVPTKRKERFLADD
ncbi:hypothetical protein K435DRAFT_799106 [Dendrothele bispora CBS 962.96]|uniref:Uncharacterized protein n=1 Tax=Dendrothele bispora (strain CBS 962.96) TaxID=1314807 RepID=A0A4V4HFA8_DENBC|nr:hypothetical protein K435DRAFT_799106 [Dendrothele bispora CBS 962.96]